MLNSIVQVSLEMDSNIKLMLKSLVKTEMVDMILQ